MTDTTIAVSNDVKERIRELKAEGETFNGTLLRLAEAYESDGRRWTEDELRSMIREEIRQVQR